jgi:CheY-like chemotaxis protein
MGSGSGAKGSILVVEDMDEVRDLAAEYLADAGYRVVTAAGAREALERLRGSGPFDLLFTDILLGDGNGLRLAREAIMLRPGLRVLYATGYARPVEAKEPMLARGELVPKPYHLAALLERVDRTFAARRFELNKVLVELWRQWRRRGAATDAAVLLGELEAIRDNVAVAAVVEPPPELRMRYTYFGATLVRSLGRDPVGRFIDEIARDDYRAFIMRVYADVISTRRGVYAASAFRGAEGVLTERLFLPLCPAGGDVASVIAAQTFDRVEAAPTAFEIVQRSPERIDIVEPLD